MQHSADNKKLHAHQLLDGRWIHNDLRDSGNIRTGRARRRLAKFARLVAEMFRPETGQLEARSLLITFLDHPNANIWDEDTLRALHRELLEFYAMCAEGRTEPAPTIEFSVEGGDSRSGLCHAHGLGSGALDEFVGPRRNRTVTLPSGHRVRIHSVRVVPPDRIWNTWLYMHKTPCSEAVRKPWQTDAEYNRARENAALKHQAGKANLAAAGILRRFPSRFTLSPDSRPEAVLLTRNQGEGLILLCQGALVLTGAPATTFRGLLRLAARAYQHTERRKRRQPPPTPTASSQGCLRPLFLLALVLLALCLILVRVAPGIADLKLHAAASPARAAAHERQHRPQHAVKPP